MMKAGSSRILDKKALRVNREFDLGNTFGVADLYDPLGLLNALGLYCDCESRCSVAYLY
jgi:hypothetical protein